MVDGVSPDGADDSRNPNSIDRPGGDAGQGADVGPVPERAPDSAEPEASADEPVADVGPAAIEPVAEALADPGDADPEAAYGLSFVVGIGASAGGLEALKALVSALPKSPQVSFIIAQHLSPQHESLLTEILSRETDLRVIQGRDGELLLPNQIVITPPNNDVTVSGQRVRLSAPHVVRGAKPSVDLFFESLSREYSERAIGVILSGTGTDGSRGVQAIKAAGGFVFAQEPETSRYDGMPRSAIATRCVDKILPPTGIARELTKVTQLRTERSLEAVDEKEQQVVAILEEVRRVTGADFLEYKRSTVLRRIESRMAATSRWSLSEYSDYISNNREEPGLLRHNILISVTQFFRDKDAFVRLREAIADQLKERPGTKPYRVWVPGCATGEEAFSLAITLDQLAPKLKVQIFATDLDDSIMDTTRKASYPETSLVGLPDDVVEDYFTNYGKGYQVRRFIRERVVFANHNLIEDPSFLHLDLVSCRNLLIYFQPALQQRVLRIFHQSLTRHGILFLGKSESIYDQKPALFREVNRKHRVFQRRNEISGRPVSLPKQVALLEQPTSFEVRKEEARARTVYLRDTLLGAFVPPSVLVDSESQVLESQGEVRQLLSVGAGKPDFSLLSLVPEELQMQLRAQLFRARREQEQQIGIPMECQIDGAAMLVRTEVRPLEDPNTAEQLFLVSFQREAGSASEERQPEDGEAINHADGYVKNLEQELETLREHLQTVVEELETSNEELQSLNEELQSSNEELQASNEELQASNEELESSNEEMQSTNEELITLNGELEQKSRDLEASLDDLGNLQNSVRSPVATVDQNMVLRRMNQGMIDAFAMGEDQIGQPLNMQRWNIGLADLPQRVHFVIASSEAYEREVLVGDRHYSLRISPYLSGTKTVGAVLMFHDVTELKRTASALGDYEQQFQDLVNYSRQGILIHVDDKPLFANQAFCDVLGFAAPQEFVDKRSYRELFSPDDYDVVAEARRNKNEEPLQVRLTTRNGDPITAILVEQPVLWQKQQAWQVSVIDVSDQVRAEEHRRQSQRLEVLGQLTGGVAHDFNNLLAVIQGNTELIQGRLSDAGDECAESILHAIARGRDLTQRLLSYARKQPLTPQAFDLGKHISTAVPLLTRTLGGRTEVNLELDGEEVYCLADRGELDSALLNLLLNARDAMADGGSILVRAGYLAPEEQTQTRLELEPGRYIQVEVVDQGHGIPPEIQSQVFDPFFTTKEAGRGSGLGLSMVYGFVKQSGGDVEIRESGASGTVVRLVLPAADSVLEPEPGEGESAGKLEGRILVVEDDEAVRRSVDDTLRAQGMLVHSVTTADAALLALNTLHFDYLLSDIRLTRSISGVELVRQVQPLYPGLRCVLMSGFRREDLDDPFLGRLPLLRKPFTAKELVLTLSIQHQQ